MDILSNKSKSVVFFILVICQVFPAFCYGEINDTLQKYIFNDGIAKVTFLTDKYLISESDSVNINIEIRNESQNNIYVLNEKPQWNRVGENGLYFDFGGTYNSHFENCIMMKILSPDSLIAFNFNIPFKKYFGEKKIEWLYIMFYWGYIDCYDTALKFNNLSKDLCPLEEKDNNYLIIHEMVLDASLKRFRIKTLNFQVRDDSL